MKKGTMFLSLVMMLGLSVSLFAEISQKESPDCMIPPPPQCQQERDFNDDMMPFWDMDMNQTDCRPCEPNMELHKKHFEKGKFFNKNFKNLNLTDKQKEDLKSLKKTNMEATKEIAKKIKEKVKALNDELLKEKYSSKVLTRILDN